MIDEKRRFYGLDATRGIAAICIVFLHSAFGLPSFWSLVDYFFVLSGFVLYPFYNNDKRSEIIIFVKSRFLYFLRLSIFSIVATYSIFLAQLIFEKISQTYGDMPANFSSPLWALPFALLLLQIFVKSSQIVNPPLWSLSAEIFANFLASFLSFKNKWHIFFLFILINIVLLIVSTNNRNNTVGVDGIIAICRVLLGFYSGLLTRKYFESHSQKFYKYRVTFFPIFLLFIFSQIMCLILWEKSIFFLPYLFSLLVFLIASSQESQNKYVLRACRFLGKFSVGIYIFQTAVEPPAAYITDCFINESSNRSLYLTVYSVVKIALSIATASFFEIISKNVSNLIKKFRA